MTPGLNIAAVLAETWRFGPEPPLDCPMAAGVCSGRRNGLLNRIAIKLVLGLALLLALFFVAAGMSFWQADAVDQKTEYIVEILEPKWTVAHEMELNSIETEMAVLEYLLSPGPALRTRIEERTALFAQLGQEYLSLASAEEIYQVANRLGEAFSDYVASAQTLIGQADQQHRLLSSLETNFNSLHSLATIDLSEGAELHTSYGPNRLGQLQIVETEIAELNHTMDAYLRSPDPFHRDQIGEHSREFKDAIASFRDLASNKEESQRADVLELLFADAESKVIRMLALKDSLDENKAAFLAQRAEIDGILSQGIQIPTRLQMNEAKDAVHSIDSQTTRATIIMLVVGLVFVFAGVFLVVRRLTNPVNELVSATKKAGEGDLSARVGVVSNDEIGMLGTAFNKMIASREDAERALVLSEGEQRRLADENGVNASIGRIISSSLDLEDVYDAFAQEVHTLIRFDWLVVSILDRDMKSQRIDYVSEPNLPCLKNGTLLPLKGSFVGAVAAHRDFLVEILTYGEGMGEGFHSVRPIAEPGFHAVLGVPLFSRDRVIGVLVFASNGEIPYSTSEIAVARNVADQVAGAISNAQIYAEREETQAQLRRAHDELENRVLERTLELEKTKDIAEEATKAKSQFLANMSHELRTPLNAVIGYSELLIDEAKDSENSAIVPDLENITNSGKLLLSLVSGILDLAKVEAGKMEMFIEGFSISSVIQEVRAITETLIQANRNKLSIDCPGDIGLMRTDQIKLRQMLLNLLSNAGKFTEEGNISLSAVREDRNGADWVVFTVTDTGIGITREAAKTIFEPFTQADTSTIHKYGGTGLGLSVCQSFSQMMGGTITVKSRPGAGATFVISLPADFNLPVADAAGLENQAGAGTASVEGEAEEIEQVSRV